MTFDFLPSDYLVWILFFFCIIAALWIRTQPHYREPWKQVFRNKIAVISCVVLCVYIVVGLLDSIHLNIANQQKSVLDLLIGHLNAHDETPYTAPFSTPHLHVYGTNNIGQDMLYETIKSIRTGLLIGTLTTVFMLPFALFF